MNLEDVLTLLDDVNTAGPAPPRRRRLQMSSSLGASSLVSALEMYSPKFPLPPRLMGQVICHDPAALIQATALVRLSLRFFHSAAFRFIRVLFGLRAVLRLQRAYR
eukprot:RCo005065